MSVTTGRVTGKKATKQSRTRHVRRRSAEDGRRTARRERLWQLFGEIEREFENLHEENLQRKQFFTPIKTRVSLRVYFYSTRTSRTTIGEVRIFVYVQTKPANTAHSSIQRGEETHWYYISSKTKDFQCFKG